MEEEKRQADQEKRQEDQGGGYYSKQPRFGNRGPSRIRQLFNRGITAFLVVAAAILFYFALFHIDWIIGVIRKLADVSMPVI